MQSSVFDTREPTTMTSGQPVPRIRSAAAPTTPAQAPPSPQPRHVPPPQRRGGRPIVFAVAAVLVLAAVLAVVAVVSRVTRTTPPSTPKSTAPHVVSAPRGDLTAANVNVVSGASSVTIRGADIGDRLYRVETPDGGALVPSVSD